ncbi:MAG: bifunctional glutamine-synthetase adenylyltransferase/deadenyltransferase, partial [Bifidobacteriaceae bacterium]|nr:bifunctional glutamine-synthetase adenylyltransferase/deadenyltransferase [Bifidobacteriaceae bacterium]
MTISIRDLIHAGIVDVEKAKDTFDTLEQHAPELTDTILETLPNVGQPDIALQHITAILTHQNSEEQTSRIFTKDEIKTLLFVLGSSDELGKMMSARPSLVLAALKQPLEYSQLYDSMHNAVFHAIKDVDEDSALPEQVLTTACEVMRQKYYEQLTSIISVDTCADDPIAIQPTISTMLSHLVDCALQCALQIAQAVVKNANLCRFAVIGMGKLGACEINYVSDVDLIYVVEPAQSQNTTSQEHTENVSTAELTKIGTKIAVMLQKICQSIIPGVTQPALWQIDTALRPEGKDGPLVRRLESHELYYEKWAENWEFQALLKARFVAGDLALGEQYEKMTQQFVWKASARKNFVFDCRKMRQRVEDLIPEELKNREIKLGKGGLRDVEFSVQMLQLVHGKSDEAL